LNWQNSIEYSIRYKKLPPESYFYKLKSLDVGHSDQNILVVGCGDGKLANYFAKQGCRVTAVDISQDYIDEARLLAAKEGVEVDYQCMPAEEMPLDNHSYDVIFVHQALKHFQIPQFLIEAKRLIAPGGVLVNSEIRRLPRLDIVAKKSDEIVLRYNTRWEHYDFHGQVYAQPAWSQPLLFVKAMFFYDEQIHYNKDEWIGRLKASNYISGTLSKSKLVDFEDDMKSMLADIPNEDLDIRHRISVHIFQFK